MSHAQIQCPSQAPNPAPKPAPKSTPQVQRPNFAIRANYSSVFPAVIKGRMDSIRSVVTNIKDWLDWLPNPVVAAIILGLAAVVALALHNWWTQLARRLLAHR